MPRDENKKEKPQHQLSCTRLAAIHKGLLYPLYMRTAKAQIGQVIFLEQASLIGRITPSTVTTTTTKQSIPVPRWYMVLITSLQLLSEEKQYLLVERINFLFSDLHSLQLNASSQDLGLVIKVCRLSKVESMIANPESSKLFRLGGAKPTYNTV